VLQKKNLPTKAQGAKKSRSTREGTKDSSGSISSTNTPQKKPSSPSSAALHSPGLDARAASQIGVSSTHALTIGDPNTAPSQATNTLSRSASASSTATATTNAVNASSNGALVNESSGESARRGKNVPRANSAPALHSKPHKYSDDTYEDESVMGGDDVYKPGRSFGDASVGAKSTDKAARGQESSQKHTGGSSRMDTHGVISTGAQSSIIYPSRAIAGSAKSTTSIDESRVVEDELRSAIRPVSNQQLTEAIQLLKYDIHREMQGLMKEQIRQFSIAKVTKFMCVLETYFACDVTIYYIMILFGCFSPCWSFHLVFVLGLVLAILKNVVTAFHLPLIIKLLMCGIDLITVIIIN
jgi:hypothetical protein